MVLGSSDTQGQTMSSVGEARLASYNEAISALSAFNSAVDLQGVAYDSGKQYGMNVITPLIKGAIMYTELLSEAVPKLPSKYRSEVGGEDLDSAVLESEIRSLESSISSLRGLYNTLLHDETTSASTLSSLSSRIDALTRQKNEKLEKLRKLNLFAGSSNEVFSVGVGYDLIASLAQNLQAGFSQIKTEFANFGGTFSSHSNDMEWAKNIEGEWTKKAEIDQNYQQVLKKIEDGKELTEEDVKAIQAYKDRFPGRNLPIDEDSKKALNRLEKDKKEGKISNDTYQSLRSGIISGGIAFLNELAKSKVIEKGVENFVKFVWEILADNPQNTQYGLVGAVAGGGTTTIPINVNPAYSQFVSGVAKYGAPIIGAAIDFTMQVNDGTDPVDASIKTGAHVTMGLIGAAVGKVSGAAVTTALGSTVVLAPLAPIAGVVTNFVVTSVISVGGSMIFDAIYDNKDKIAKWGIDTFNSAKDIVNGVGDAISGALNGLGSVFG